MTKQDKSYEAGVRALEILRILLDKNLTRKELIAELKATSELDKIYTSEALLKYFNAFKMIGLKFRKKNHTYEFKNSLFKTVLSKEEENAFIVLLNNYRSLHDRNAKKLIGDVTSKVNKYVDIDLVDLYEKIIYTNEDLTKRNLQDNLVATLENMMADKQYVDIVYRKSVTILEKYTVVIREISEIKDRYYAVCYIPKEQRNQRFYINNIVELHQQPKIGMDSSHTNSVIYRLTGRLSLSYKLKKSECVIDFSDEHLTISNKEEDKEALLLRLLKYGDCCKILKPDSFRNDFLDLTDKIISNQELDE